jgi:hypothetical protein
MLRNLIRKPRGFGPVPHIGNGKYNQCHSWLSWFINGCLSPVSRDMNEKECVSFYNIKDKRSTAVIGHSLNRGGREGTYVMI